MNNCPTCGARVESLFEHVDLDKCPEEKDWLQWEADYTTSVSRVIRRMRNNPDIIDIHRKSSGEIQTFKAAFRAEEFAKKLNDSMVD